MNKTSRFILSVAIFLSGVCWLVFELVWSRYLTLIFGASVFAVTSVLACFMLGMALGSWLLGRLADRAGSEKLLIWLNLGIGLYGLLSPLIFAGIANLNVVIFSHTDADIFQKNSLRFLFSFVVLIAPTFGMGGAFPLMVRLLTHKIEGVGQGTSYVYWVNTLGGALGAFVTGFVLIRFFGLNTTTMLAALVNLSVAGLLFVFLRTPTAIEAPSAAEKPKEKRGKTQAPMKAPTRMRSLILIVFGISGFTGLAYEVFFTRVLTLFFRDSVYDFAIVLTTFLTGLALGSLISGKLLEKYQRPLPILAVVEGLVGLFAILSLWLIGQLPYIAGYLQSMPTLYNQYGPAYWTAVTAIKFGYAFGAMLLPTCLLGMTFPLANRIWVNDLAQLGKDVGLLNGINTLGSMLGALLAGFLFITLFGTQNSIILMALLNIGLGVLLLMTSDAPRKYAIGAGIVVTAALMLFLVPPWDRLRMSTLILDPNQPLEESLSLLYYNEDAYGIISVADVVPLQTKVLTTNRLYSQNTSVMSGLEDHRRLGHIPVLLHPNPHNVLVVGLGAGITLRGVSEVPGLESIDCVEISDGVKKAAQYFSVENNHILENPKIHYIIEDGRNFISTSPNGYDVIIADIFFPMSSGSSALFSSEHFKASRAHLKRGGLMVQWLPAHQLSMDEIKIITQTFQSVFPHTSIWYGMIGTNTPVIGLVGAEQKLEIDLANLESRYKDATFAANLQETNLDDPYILLSNFIMEGNALHKLTEGQPINTDDHPIIEFTNPLIYENFATRGVDNLLHFNKLTEDVLPYLKLADQASLDLEAIRTRLERIKAEIHNILLNSN